jgi:hypothetical protein
MTSAVAQPECFAPSVRLSIITNAFGSVRIGFMIKGALDPHTIRPKYHNTSPAIGDGVAEAAINTIVPTPVAAAPRNTVRDGPNLSMKCPETNANTHSSDRDTVNAEFSNVHCLPQGCGLSPQLFPNAPSSIRTDTNAVYP